MLEFIRKHSSSVIVKVFLTILALTFVFCFGISDVIRRFSGKDYIVKIGNVKITPVLFKQEKARKLHMLRSHTKDIDEKSASASILHQIIWENIIDLASSEFGFVVSDETMKKYISGMNVFRDENGKFNANSLRGFLQKIQVPEAMFLESSKKDIKNAMIKAPFKYVSVENEADLYTRANLEKRSLIIVELNPISFNIDKKATQEELKEFYKNHPEKFMENETRSFRVLELQESSIEKNIKISEEDLKDAYEFSTEKEERSYESIKLELEANLRQERLQNEINDITRQIEDSLMAGDNMDTIAKKFNLNIIKVENIDSANPSSKQLEKLPYKNDIISIAFSTEEGSDSSFSEALNTNKNRVFWLVHLDNITPKHVAEFAKISDKVDQEWKKNKQHEKAVLMADEFVAKVKNGENLEKLVSKNGRITKITQLFDRYGVLQDEKNTKFSKLISEIYKDAFEKRKTEASYKEIDGITVVYKVKDIIQAKEINSKDNMKYKATLIKESTEDMYQQLVGYLSKRYEVTINHEMLKLSNEDINPSNFDEIF